MRKKYTRIKICGLTNLNDTLVAVHSGADAVGFIFAPSRRRIDPENAQYIIQKLPPFVSVVGVFMNQSLDEVKEIMDLTGVEVVQLHGGESPEFCEKIPKRIIKRIPIHQGDAQENLIERMKPYTVSAFILDPGAGDGQTFDWEIAKSIEQPIILAGGLTTENVKQAVHIVQPDGVDVSSGVEIRPGDKDPRKIKQFIQEVR